MKRWTLLLIATLLTVGGCASPATPVPANRLAADRASREAMRWTTRAEWAAARAAWARAATLHAAIDDGPAYVAARIGQAQALAALGDRVAARALIEATLAEPLLTPALRAELEYERAVIDADLGDYAAVEDALARARSLNPTPGLQAALDNLDARQSLERGAFARALDLALAVQTRTGLVPTERANARLTEGRARLALGQLPAARAALEEALTLNQTLARPAALWRTLQALSVAWAGQAQAAVYARRAALVCAAWPACPDRPR